MPVILVKLIMICSGSGVPPRRAVVPGSSPIWVQVSSWSRESRTAWGRSCWVRAMKLGQGVQVDGGGAEPVAGAQPGKGVDRLERRVGARTPGTGHITESDLKPR